MTISTQVPAQPQFMPELLAVLRQDAFHDPMFEAIRSGQMSRAGLKVWVLQAMLVVHEFTRFISALHASCPDRDGQALLAENLWEEHGRGKYECDHYSLVIKLAKSLGASDQEIAEAVPLPETSRFIDHCLRISHDGSFVEGMTAIGVGIERFMPRFFGALADGLITNYGLTRQDVEYLLVHVGEDEDHARRAIELIERYADHEEVRNRAKQALRDTLRLKRSFSEAIFQRALLAD